MSGNVCRYFLNNSCRYGDRCWYSHDTNGKAPPYNAYKYVKKQDEPDQTARSYMPSVRPSDIEGIIQKIAEEAKMVETENMWPFTCLSVLRDMSNVPGWEDYSMEELRAAAYTSKVANCFPQYITFFESLKNKAKANRLVFIRPGKKAEEIVRGMFENINSQTNKTSTSANASFSFHSNHVPSFSGATSTSSFGSTFGGSGGSLFSKDPAPGIFAMAARGFNPSSSPQQFGQASKPINDTAMETAAEVSINQTSNAFASPFNQNIFGQVQQPNSMFSSSSSPSFFPTSQPPPPPSHFGAAPQPPSQTLMPNNNNVVYTLMNELTVEEIEQFRATTFTLDKLPLRPPPQELC